MIQNYLKEQYIDFKETNGIYTIGDETYSVVESGINGFVLDDSFELILAENQPNTDYFVFQFGEKWYYTSSKVPEVSLTPFKYVGVKKGSKLPLPYVGIHGMFELLNGSRNYKDWCVKSKFLGYTSIGICEKNTLAGTMKFQNICKEMGINSIIGASYDIIINDNKNTVKFYVKDLIGWKNLLKLNEICNVINNGSINLIDALKYTDGLVVVIDTKVVKFDTYKRYFKDFYYQIDGTEFNDSSIDKDYLLNLQKYLVYDKNKALLIQDSYYIDKEDSDAKILLNKISGNKTEHGSSNQYLKSVEELYKEVAYLLKEEDFIDIIGKTMKVFSMKFRIETGKRHLPEYIMTEEESKKFKTNEDLFWFLINKGFKEKGFKDKKYFDRLQREVKIIKKGGVIDYFLILWDIIKWAKSKDIKCGFARGSAGGSLVSYLLQITFINPMEFDLLFERFLTEGRLGKFEEQKKLIIETDGSPVEYWLDEKIIIERDNKKIVIEAKDLKENDIL